MAAVKASFNFCTDVLSKMDDSKLVDSIELFGANSLALLRPWGWSLSDHSGMAALYLRLNGILPSSAQPKK